MSMESLPSPSLNTVLIDGVSERPVREVEIRLDLSLARAMFEKMDAGLFPGPTRGETTEVGCSW